MCAVGLIENPTVGKQGHLQGMPRAAHTDATKFAFVEVIKSRPHVARQDCVGVSVANPPLEDTVPPSGHPGKDTNPSQVLG